MTPLGLVFVLLCLVCLYRLLRSFIFSRYVLFVLNILFLVVIGWQSYQGLLIHLLIATVSYWLPQKKWALSVVMALNLLFFWFLKVYGVGVHWVVPTGFAFFSLRVFSYRIDQEKRKLTENPWGFLQYFNYVYFFVTLISGPIVKAKDHAQVSIPKVFSYYRVYSFTVLFALGIVKKFVISDNLYPYVQVPIENANNYVGWPVLMAVLLSKLLIYMDFSGYSDMARGLGRLMGISLPQNFNAPFLAKNMKDFWRRWHSSLSFFIYEYVFLPLTISPVRKWGLFGLLFITYFVLAMWHSFTWPFLLYGIIQALLLYYDDRIFSWFLQKTSIWRKALRIGFLYFFILALPSVLFRVSSLDEVWSVLMRINPMHAVGGGRYFSLTAVSIWPVLGLAILVELATWRWPLSRVVRLWSRRGYLVKLLVLLFVGAVFIYYVDLDDPVPFIYSRF